MFLAERCTFLKAHGRTSLHYVSSPLLPVIWCLVMAGNTTRRVRKATQAAEWVIFKPLPPFKVFATWIFFFFFPCISSGNASSQKQKHRVVFWETSCWPFLSLWEGELKWCHFESIPHRQKMTVELSHIHAAWKHPKWAQVIIRQTSRGGLQTPTLFQFCPSRTYGKIRVWQKLRLALSAVVVVGD